MEMAADIVSWICLALGGLLVFVGGIGVLRLPDVYTRSHAAGVTDTGGAFLILIGLMFQAGFTLVTVKLILILIFLFFTSPTATHALIHTAHSMGLKPGLSGGDDPEPTDDDTALDDTAREDSKD